jgi:hypothetical protein
MLLCRRFGVVELTFEKVQDTLATPVRGRSGPDMVTEATAFDGA